MNNGQLYLNLTTLHPTAGGTDPHNFTLTTGSGDVIDAASFNAVGRRAFGDIDLNDDEDELYVISLSDRRLYTIPVAADPSSANAPTMASQVPFLELNTTAAFPGLNSGLTASVSSAEIIPFALKYWKDRLYIGCVGNGQAGGPLVAFVYEYNPNTQALTSKVLEFTLDYNRGCAFAESPRCWGPAKWQPWWNANTYPPITMDSPYSLDEQGYPQAIFTDIEFLTNGTMVIGLRDRFGDQGGFRVARPDDSPGGAFSDVVNDAFGDILVAQKGAGNTWSLNIADFTDNTIGNAAGTLPITGNEPSFGADRYQGGPFIHEETAMGGLGVLNRTNGIVTPSMDPRVNAFSNGIDWFNSDGTLNKAITILTNTNSPFGKANGLGEIEFASRQAPIEIGNRIWKDANGNGIQDPGEDGINGVLVELYKETAPATFTKVAETTTAANGDQGNGAYKFSVSGTAGQTWMGGQTEVLPNMNYQIRVSLTNVQSIDAACTGFSPTNQTADATNDRFTDLADSDGTESAGIATISFSTTDVGESNHTLDMGVVACSVTLSNLAVSACSNGLYTLTGDVAYAGGPSPLGLMTITVDNDGTPVSVQIDPALVSSFSIPNLGCDSDANVVVTASFDNDNTCSDTETYDEPLCSMDIAITNVTGCSGGTYSIEGSISVSNAPLGGSIVISFTESGTPQTVTLPATATTFQFTGLTCDGDNNIQVDASFDNFGACSDSESYDEPCLLEITALNVTDNCSSTGTYDLEVVYNVYNASGDITIEGPEGDETVAIAAGSDIIGGSEILTLNCVTLATPFSLSVYSGTCTGGGASTCEPFTPCLAGNCPALTDYPSSMIPTGPPAGGFRGTDANFNVIVAGDFTVTNGGGAETEGRIAVGGNFVMNNGYYGVGTSGGGTYVIGPDGENNLIVRGDIQRTEAGTGTLGNAQGGTSIVGNIFVGGTVDADITTNSGNPATIIANQSIAAVDAIIDIASIFNDLGTKSDCFAALTPTGVLNTTTFTLEGDGTSSTQVFNLSASDLSMLASQNLLFDNIPANATIIVNVTAGGTVVWNVANVIAGIENDPGYITFGAPDPDVRIFNLLFNFNAASQVNFNSTINGSVLVKNGNVDLAGNINGRLAIGGNFTHSGSGTEVHNYSFTGDCSCGAGPCTADCSDSDTYTPPILPASIGNLVWEDNNLNGVQDPGEPGVPNILVRLFECNAGVKGAEVTSQLTDINGQYSFTGLTPNMEYCVEFDLDNSTNTDANNYIFTTQDQTLNGGDDTNDSDANPVDGCTTGYTPMPGEDYPDFDAGIYKFDFGDFPENNNYPTTTANSGAAHVVPISPQLYLGATVDAEPDGQPEAMAGAMAGGDDGNGDDEDGITFVTPLIAGYQACIEVDAVNGTGSNAILQAWIDFNNDGTLDAADELTTGDFAPSGAIVPNGGLSGAILCFDVPASATFNGGQAFSRFRLSAAGGLSPNGIALDGEVEDYKITLSKVGNYVWLDSNNNGEQDEATTAGVNGVEVTLTFGGADDDIATAGDNLTYVTTTANVGADGVYYFCGLIPGKYELSLSNISTGYSPSSLINNTADADTDSEDAAGVEFMIMNPGGLTTGEDGTNDNPGIIDNFPDSQDEINYDFALIAVDYGDLPDTYTTIGGPSHIIDTDLFLGACIDAEPAGQPEPMAGMMTGGDDNNGSTVFEFGACAGADEDGVNFPTPLIAGNQACIEVSAVNNTGSNAILQGWIDFNGNGTFEAAEELTSVDFAPGGATVPDGGLTNAILCFDVPATATFDGGAAFSRFRLSTTGGLSYDVPGGSGEVEDHKQILSKVGNLVWLDENNNGFQDEPNSGVNGATVQLEWGGPDGDVGTAGDNQIYQVNTFQDGGIDGIYYFCGLIPGTYELSIPNLPMGYDPGQVDIIPGNDVEDADDPTGVEFTITDPTNLVTGEDGVGDMPGGTDGFADNQDELIYDFVLVVDEYGDLPDSYTTTGNSAAAHIIDTDLYLGTCIDAEQDGQPEPMAGMMTGGDDNNGSTLFEHGTCTGGDDEDGIQFVTPMIPGYQACIEATVFNNTGGDVYLQAWIDFAGNGVFDGSDELTTGDFAGGSVIVPNGGFTDQTLCFDVPTTATFNGGAAFARFRLSSTGGLSSDGAAIDGEVEDYKESLAKVGNLVWEDRNYDGIQGSAIDEPGINGIEVILTWYGADGVEGGTDDVAYSLFTANVGGKDGIYYFCGLIAGEYDMEVITDRYPTLLGQTVETQDSDDESGESVSIVSVTGLITMEDGTSDMPGMINNFPDNQDNQSFDFGYTGIDFGDLPDGFNTTMTNNGAAHSWKPGLYLGSCLDFETDGAPTAQADGDDTAPGLFNDGTCSGPDDEDGIVLVTPLIPGAQACVEITATSTVGGAFVNGWIDFDGDGTFDVNEQLIFTAVDGAPITPTAEGVIPNGTSTQLFCFDVPATATFEGGETHMRFRLSMNGGTAPDGLVISGEVEDYWQPLAKAGNLVWEDLDFDGIQDTGEPGLDGVTVELTWYGPNGVEDGTDDVTYTLVTDGNGNYYFCGLTPGTYEIAPIDPTDMTPSPAMATDDYNDSEHPSLVINIGDVFNLPTGENGLTDNPGGTDNFPDNQEDISIDFAYIGIDYGDLPDGFATLEGSNGAAHLMQDGKYLGSCVDAELDGAPDAQAGDSGTTGDDGTVSAFSKGTCNGDDDEDGVKLITPLVPGNTSCIEVTSTLPSGGGFLNAWIDFDGDGQFGAGEQVVFTGDGVNGVLAAGTDVVTELCFEVPIDAVFEGLETHMRFRLSCDGNLGPDGLALDGEVEDYYQPLAKLGNLVWEDLNGNGIQDAGEPGIGGIEVTLDVLDANGNPYQVVVTTDATGMYMFIGLLPTPDVSSPYTLTFTKPGPDWVATAEDSPNTFGIPGDDTDNSDIDELTLTIDNIVLAPQQYDEDEDAGYVLPADVGNYVWVDLDELGDQGDNILVENAKLTLTGVDGLGRPVMLVLYTDPNGEYLFEDLWPGEYMIEFDLTMITGPIELVPFADQLVFTIPNSVADDQDSDVDQGDYGTSPIGNTSLFTLISQDLNLTFDVGVAIPCLQPINLMADNLMPTTAQINWTATNDPFTGIDLTNHCWRILVGGEGFAVDNSMAVIDVIVCAGPANGPTPGLTINGANVSYTIEGLALGTCYDYYIVETCDGSAPPSNVTDFTGIGQFCTPDMPFMAEIQNLKVATCPGGSDGSFDIVITDGNSCGPNIYNVTQLSGPTTLTPSMLTNQGEGVFTFTGAAEGTYTIEFDEIGPCTPFNDPEVVTVVVDPGVDTEDPIFYLTDIFGNILADTDPNTSLSNTLDLGDLTMPEGECDRQDQFLVYGTDNCEQPFGFITTPGAVTVSAQTTPASIIPGTQVVSPAVLDGSGINYLIDIHWSAGQTLVTIEGQDASANTVQLFINANVIADEDDLAIVAQPITAVIPACGESMEVLFGVTITGGCDATLTGEPDVELFGTHLSNLQLVFIDLTSNYFEYSVVVTPGATPLNDYITIEYTTSLGTTESTSIGVTSESVLEDQDPVIYANAEHYTIPACEEAANVIYSFTVCDDCQEMDVNAITFDDDGAGLTFFYSDDAGNNCVYVEYSGAVMPGTYFPSITYGPTTAVPSLVVTQDADQLPVIDMPGNLNFTIPVCEESVDQVISLTLSDDCDEFISTDGINIDDLTLTLAGQTLTPSYFVINEHSVYVEYVITVTTEMSGELLVASYGGVTVDAQIVVTGQPDVWAPLIIYPSQDINVELDPCESNIATVIFEVTATDNCGDEDIDLTVTVNPANAGGLILDSPGGDSYVGFFEANESYQILITATDADGNTRQEDFFVNVTQEVPATPNQSCRDNINVTLGEDCQAEMQASLLLTGEFGCLTEADFDITIVDSDPSNGAIVDGCGEFPYQIQLATPEDVAGFTGPFAPGNWSILEENNGTVDFSVDNQSIAFVGPDGGACTNGEATAMIAIPADGTVTFDYDWSNLDVGWDAFVVTVNVSTGIIDTENFGTATGTVEIDVVAGDVLLIGVVSEDCFGGAGNALVDNFSFEYASDINGGAFTNCWGYINAEDKDDPVLECPDDTNQALLEATTQTLEGTIADTDPTIQALQYPCFYEVLSYQNPGANDVEDDFHYDLFTFTVTQSDNYTFFFESDDFTGANGGAMALMFQGGFDANEPCSNVIFQNDQQVASGALILFPSTQGGGFYSNFNPLVRITLPLEAGQTYTLLTTGTFATTLGDYTWTVYSDGNGVVQGTGITAPQTATALAELVCDDINELSLETLPDNVPHCYTVDADGNVIYPTNFQERQRLQQLLDLLAKTGYPVNGDPFNGLVTDNCGDITVCVEDVLTIDPNCAPNTIQRTFTAVDAKGNAAESCTQTISARKLTLADVMAPPLTAFVECDEGDFTTENPSPAITGYPFVQTAHGFENLGVDGAQEYCNLAAQYTDQPRIEVCPSAYKFVRSWNVLNWCNPIESQLFVQIIKVGDFSAPEITCTEVDYNWDGEPDMLTFSTGPFDCTAAFAIPAPEVTDNCSDYTISTEVVTTVQDTIYDQWGINIVDIVDVDQVIATIAAGEPQYVSGIPLGCHRFRYTVTDECGNTAVQECPFQVEDQVEPIAVCNDDLNISISGDAYARVYAEDIDEGSSDNCGPIRIEVRRLYTEDASCNTIPPFYSPWGDYVDFNCCDVNDMVTIELRVWDDRNGDGIPGNTIPVTYCDGTTKLVTDNSNTCWLEVLVEDKIRPICTPPHAEVLDCNDLPYNFSATDTLLLQELFGNATADDNCPTTVYTQELPPINNLDDCGFGTIIRRFRAIDAQGNVSTNSCQQLITINEVHEYEIKFPKDAEAFCGEPMPDTMFYEELGCDLLAVEIVDDTLSASGDECYKIFRQFQVVNWCEYDGISQAIKVSRDEDCDGNPGDEDVWVLVRPNGITYFDRDHDEANNNPFAFTKGTSCDGLANPTGHWINSTIDVNATRDPITGVVQQGAEPIPNIRDIASRGFWKYEQHIKVYDNVDPIITVDAYDAFCSEDGVACTGEVTINFSVEENCTPDDIEVIIYLDVDADGSIDFNSDDNPGVVSLSGSYPNYSITGTYPIGDHEFSIRVDDGCGNYSSADAPFTVVDCKAPTPICINGLAIELMPQPAGTDADGDGDGDEDCAAMAIWANDFIASPVYDCTGQGDPSLTNPNVTEILKYSIHRAASVVAGVELPDPSVTGLVATCDDPATLIVRIYAWDDANNPYSIQPDGSVGGPNYDFCETYILVQDNQGACEGANCGGVGSRIAGVIMTEDDEEVEGVEVGLSGQTEMEMITQADGAYEFSDLENGYDYTVTPLLDLDHANGVSTFDLVLISKHILGVTPLNSPYKMIAADANNSKSITTLDIIQIRKLILNINTDFPSNTSWRFVDAAYVFPDPTDPWAEVFPEVLNYNNLNGDQLSQDFVAVKIGDVNGSAQTNLTSVEDRTTNGLFAFELEDEVLKSGNDYTLDFRASDLNKIQGYQLTLTFDEDQVSFTGMTEGVNAEEHFGFQYAEQGVLTMSWNMPNGQLPQVAADEVLFSLHFRAQNTVRWSEVLGVSSSYTMAEAYNAQGELLEVGLHFSNGPTLVQNFELYQNRPNPFREMTFIGFYLPQSTKATLVIRDASGRILKQIRDDYDKGYQEVVIKANELPKGVLYYTLQTDDHTATRNMMILD